MKSLLLLAYILLVCFLAPGSMAQDLYFKNYQVNDGLSGNTITSILQDSKGFMWFGTRNGLNRFDGYSFRTFRNIPTDSFSIGSNSILSLCEDNNEQLWIGTYKGVYIYDPAIERFTLFRQLPEQEVRCIAKDALHNMWIVADQLLYRYNPSSGQLKTYSFPFTQSTAVVCSPTGKIWVAGSSGIIMGYDSENDQFISYDIRGIIPGIAANAIQDIYPVNDSTLLVGTMYNALLLHITGRGSFRYERLYDKIQVHRILHQKNAEYWLGTETGLLIMDLQTGRRQLIKKQQFNPYSITDNVIYSLYRDLEGGTWIGSFFGGVNYYSKQNNLFRKYFPRQDINSISGNIVHEICGDDFGNIWIGTEDAGLNKLESSGQILHFKATDQPGSLSYNNIHGLLAVGNELWVGTYEHGLDVLNIATGKVVRHYKAGPGRELKSNFIVTLYRTRAGDVLAGTWNGLFRYNRTNDDFDSIPFFNSHIQSVHEDHSGTIWVGTYGKGVYYQNMESGQSGILQYDPGRTNSISNNYVNNVFEDSDHQLWFSTEAGLNKYDPIIKKFSRYTMAEGLPDNQVFRVQEDNKGMLWISTAKGLLSASRDFGKLHVYTTAHGLISNQFNYNSSFKAKDGRLFFGTVKGMISFDPAEFVTNTFVPPVYITGIQVNNKEMHVGQGPLHFAIPYEKSIKLSYDSSSVSFDVAALNYTNPQLNHYAYKMEGFDKDWTMVDGNRRIYYTKLPPGSYTFRVKASGEAAAWNSKETSLQIHISPPWWASYWAYAAYLLLLGAILAIIFRYYSLAQKEKAKRNFEIFEREKEREIYNAKIDFFTNVAHEIRTPLTLIKLPFDKLESSIEKPELHESLHIMKKNINRLVDLTNQLLDFRKAEANNFTLNFTRTDVNEILSEVFQAFRPAAEQKGLQYTLELPRIALQAYVDHEAVQKIMSNLLNNAIKYAESIVSLRLLPFSSEDTVFNVEVKNDGYLIPWELKEKIFEPFYRIRESQKEEGTGIGLPLSRALAELHKGVLDLKKPENGHNIFWLSLPIHQDIELSFDKEQAAESQPAAVEERDAEMMAGERPAIMLVEDNKDILDFVHKELKEQYRVIKALNGQEALDLLQDNPVNLIISDIMMPVMNGIELCRKVKNDLQFSHIPFIMLTAKNSLNAKIEGLEVGADAYIEKPFSFEHLNAQISNLLNNRQIIKEYFARSPLSHFKGIAYSKADNDFLEKLNEIIYEHITDMDLDVEQLSRLMNMSRPTLYRKIKALSDLSPNELINLSRLKKAAELLSQRQYKINEVANMVGYTIQSNFSRDFSRQFGMSPSQYLAEIK